MYERAHGNQTAHVFENIDHLTQLSVTSSLVHGLSHRKDAVSGSEFDQQCWGQCARPLFIEGPNGHQGMEIFGGLLGAR